MEGPLAVQPGEDALVFRQRPEDGVVRLLLGQERQHLRFRDDDRGAQLPGGGGAARGRGRPSPAHDLAGGGGPRRAAQDPQRRHGAGGEILRGDARRARRRQGARLSRRPRARSGHAGQVPPGLRTGRALRAQGAPRQGRDIDRGHDRSRAAGRRRRHPGALRPLPRPGDVSDHRSARPRHRLRRTRAREGRAGEIPELAGDAALPQGRDALQHRRRARRRAQGRAGDRGRRLCRRDRHGDRRLRGDGGAARHRAHRRPARAAVEDGGRADALLRRRFRRAARRLSRRRSGACR